MKRIIKKLLSFIPFFRKFILTRGKAVSLNFRTWFRQKIMGTNRKAYWPVHFASRVTGIENILVGKGTAPGYAPGCYIQGIGKIIIGKYTRIAQNCGIISANHDYTDSRKHTKSEVIIGDYCWLGMNVVILPGVELGNHTIVGAGSVVTKSFSDGYCIIAGNPAKKIKDIPKGECVDFDDGSEYIGYIKAKRFDIFRKKRLKV